jgi:predicted phage baseplate assembly protein
MNFSSSTAIPAISLAGTYESVTTSWAPVPDLLSNGASDAVFVVEVETDGTARLRFGDNVNGRTPESGTTYMMNCRIGNGSAGDVGAEAITYFALTDPDTIQQCRNPLPASGGTDPESSDQIRRHAPQAFLTQERAVTMADYAAQAEVNPQVERASAALRWTGSWYTVFVAAEPAAGGTLMPALAQTLRQSLERYRLAGQDLQLESPQYVSLEIALTVCVESDYFQSDVETALQQIFSNRELGNGQTGIFYPGNFTFGQSVYLSPIYAAARAVAGVCSLVATIFQPQGVATSQYLDAGELPLGPMQVARLDNDPSYPAHGQLTLNMQGGR